MLKMRPRIAALCLAAGTFCYVGSCPAEAVHEWQWPLSGVRRPRDLNCGLASILTWVWLRSGKLDASATSHAVNISNPTMQMLQLRSFARDHGLTVDGYRASVGELASARRPEIAHVQRDHFELVDAFTQMWVRTYVAGQPRLLSRATFAAEYKGHALCLQEEVGTQSANGMPAITKPIWDAGTIAGGQLIHLAVPLRNDASNPLRITGICRAPATQPDLPLPEVPLDIPSNTTTDVVLQARAHEWPLAQAHWALRTTSASHPVVVVTVFATVDRVLSVRPAQLDFGSIQVGQSAKHQQLKVIAAPHRGVRVTAIRPSTPEIQCRVTYSGELQRYCCSIQVTVSPRASRTEFRESVLIHTNYEPVPTIYVPIVAELHAATRSSRTRW